MAFDRNTRSNRAKSTRKASSSSNWRTWSRTTAGILKQKKKYSLEEISEQSIPLGGKTTYVASSMRRDVIGSLLICFSIILNIYWLIVILLVERKMTLITWVVAVKSWSLVPGGLLHTHTTQQNLHLWNVAYCDYSSSAFVSLSLFRFDVWWLFSLISSLLRFCL